MAKPEAHPAATINQTFVQGAFVKSASALLAVLFSTAVALPVLATIVSVPIVTGAGFLVITANISGRRVGFGAGPPTLVIDVDGASVLGAMSMTGGVGGAGQSIMAGTIRVAVLAGAHTVDLRVSQVTPGGSFAIDPATFPLQDSASLVVEEVTA